MVGVGTEVVEPKGVGEVDVAALTILTVLTS
jgi:hypothetical protein